MPKQTTPIAGQATNKDKSRRKIFKTIPFDMTGKKWVKDTSAQVNTWKLVKIK